MQDYRRLVILWDRVQIFKELPAADQELYLIKQNLVLTKSFMRQSITTAFVFDSSTLEIKNLLPNTTVEVSVATQFVKDLPISNFSTPVTFSTKDYNASLNVGENDFVILPFSS